MKVVVLAFDGLIADTLGARGEALQHALKAEGLNVEAERVRSVLPGRTLHEAAAAIVGDADQTLLDLVALRAQQDVSLRLARGVSLAMNSRAFVDAQRTAGTGLVLRSDSLRRDVERILQLTDLELAFTFVRCPDDLPRARGVSTLEGSYLAISKRLDSLGVLDRRAIECTLGAADVARRLVGRADAAEYLDVTASHH